MPRGGARPGSGRPKGAKNAATRVSRMSLAELARSHTTTAINALVKICKKSESEAARVSAATALLDRGYGKPPQAIEHGGTINHSYQQQLEKMTDAEISELAGILGIAAPALGGDSGTSETQH